MKIFHLTTALFFLTTLPALAGSGENSGSAAIDITTLATSGMGYFSIFLFVGAYILVIFEEQLHLRKSKPVLLAAGIIWVLVAVTFAGLGDKTHAEEAIRHNLLEYARAFSLSHGSHDLYQLHG